MTNNIIIANNFFSNEECKDLIELYSLLEHKAVKAEPHRGSELAMYSSKKNLKLIDLNILGKNYKRTF